MTKNPKTIWRSYEKRFTALEQPLVKAVEATIRRQVKSVTRAIKTDGIQGGLQAVNNITPDDMVKQLQRIHKVGAINEASYTYKTYKPQQKARTYGYSEAWTAIIETYLNNINLLGDAANITDTTKRRILQLIQQGQQQGLSLPQIVQLLLNDDIPGKRAALIVRTELTGATNFGSLMGVVSTGIVYQKSWLAASDERVRGMKPGARFSHVALNGDVVDLDKPFNNGENIFYPGDKGGNGRPKTSAGNICNCRCTMIYLPKRNRDGSIMMYQQTQGVPQGTLGNLLLQILFGAILSGQINLDI